MGSNPDEVDDDDQWEDEESSEEDEYHRNAAIKKFSDDEMFKKYPQYRDLKMVLVVRNDLKMGKGKLGAQCGHATLGAYTRAKKHSEGSKYWTKLMEKYRWEGQKKICVKVDNEE